MHFKGELSTLSCESAVKERTAKIVGAYSDEVVCMNSLSVNMHLLLISFYRPTVDRYKIMIEEHTFPSDRVSIDIVFSLHG